MDAQTRGWRWSFGEVVLDEAALELTVAGEVVALEPKALELLRVLVRRPGEVVTKDELLDAVWPGRVVTEGVLGKAVAKLRAALRDDDSQLVRTAHGYGYRLVAEVRAEALERSAEPSPLALEAGQAVAGRRHWLLQRRLGEGGHGEVWLVEHDKTRERRVFKFARNSGGLGALKREVTLFRLFLDALGERPDLAPVLDWNFDEAPYFIESPFALQGSLLDYADGLGGIARLPLATRLELAAQIADALAAAHSVGVLHKDLKPGNVLIHAESDPSAPRAQLTDFGSARLLDPGQLEALGITRLGYTRTQDHVDGDSTSGTPLYLAPELLAGHAPTLRSDVYALGVLLWQLVIGDLRRPLAPGWERLVDDPLLREDIAACIDGEVSRRLDSAAELARRLRSLDARRSGREQALREVQARQSLEAAMITARTRRRWLAAIAVTLAIGTFVASLLALRLRDSEARARAQAQRADAQAARAAAVSKFLIEDLMGQADPGNPAHPGNAEPTLRAAIDGAIDRIDERFADQPANEAAVRRAIAGAHIGRGEFDAALAQLDAAERAIDGVEVDADLRLDLRGQRAEVAFARGRFDEARVLLGDPDGLAVAPGASEAAFHAAWLSALVEMRLGRVDGAIMRLSALVEAARAHYGPDDPSTLMSMRYHSDALRAAGRFDEARDVAEASYRSARRNFGTSKPVVASYAISLARIESRLGNHTVALELLLEAQSLRAGTGLFWGPADLILRELIASAHADLGQTNESLAIARLALSEAMEAGVTAPDALITLGNIARLIGRIGSLDESIARATEVAALWQEHHPPTRPEAIVQRAQRARLLQQAGRWREAEAEQREALALAGISLPAGSAQLGAMHLQWAESLQTLGRDSEALAQFDLGLEIAATEEARGSPLPDIARYRDLRERLDRPPP
jgi:DNA-binding winged helix-turn-helix (wHTH) protein/tetratricopeptide (TPR) repeat protein